MLKTIVAMAALGTLMCACGCSDQPAPVADLASFPVNDLNGVLTQDNLEIDPTTSYDGAGSVRFQADEPTVVRLFELGGIDVENARLTYQARVRTENLNGQAFLEMWCAFDGKGEYFSRDLNSPLSGTTDWATEETYFFLEKGQNPDRVMLNLVVNGTGTVWIDDIRLKKGPLN